MSRPSDAPVLDVGGRELALPPSGRLIIGRDPRADVVVDDDRVSWRHAEVTCEQGSAVIRDLDSRNGTWVDGVRLGAVAHRLGHASTVTVGGTRLRYRGPDAQATTRRAATGIPVDGPLLIGRAPNCDITLDEPNVSWRHARIDPGSPPRVFDLGSRNGTRVGERFVGRADLHDNAEIGIGPFRLTVREGGIVVDDQRQRDRLVAREVTVTVPGRVLLEPTSVSVGAGEFVALIGESGSGKTTLLKALAGISPPTGGVVTLGDDPVALRGTDVGYVPQRDTVHDLLTVTEALRFAGQLRLPSDTSPDELSGALRETLDELELAERADVRVQRLSGGQQKRVAVGTELISRPTMLLLDEPTSGLDPRLERRLMESMRRLADSGRGVVVVTHATSSLSLCDAIAVMGPGGRLRYFGPPAEALAAFGVTSYDELYTAVASPADDSEPGTAPGLPAAPRPAGHARSGILPGRTFLRQTRILTARFARVWLRDRRTLLALLGQVPVIAVCIAVLFPSRLLAHPDLDPSRSTQLIFLLVTASLWLGLISSCREVVKERSIVIREVSVGVRLDAYVASKMAVLVPLTAVQSIVLLGVTALLQPLHEPASAYGLLLLVLVLTAWTSAALGLLVSTFARSVDQATSFVPLLLIPQLLFAGALVPYATMRPAIKVISDLVFARWAYAGAGHTIGLNGRFAEDPKFQAINSFGTAFFHLPTAACAVILVGFLAAFLTLAGVLLSRRVNRPE